jgi:hypothetical protein
MTYQDQANLAADPQFVQRLTACTVEQANIFKDDGRPEMANLGNAVLTDPGATIAWFVWPLATLPGFGDAFATDGSDGVTDGMMLSGTQTVWPTIGALHTP